MANKNVTIKKRNVSNNDWDELYPVTTAENVKCEDGSSVDAQLADIAYKTVGGTADAITVSKQGFALTDGQYVEFKATANNTGNMTIKVNSEAVKSLRNEDGEQLSNGDIEANKYYKAIYNGTSDFFQLAPKGGARINGIKKTFPIASGQTISKGDFVRFINKELSQSVIASNTTSSITTLGTSSVTLSVKTAKFPNENRTIFIYTVGSQIRASIATVTSSNTLLTGGYIVIEPSLSGATISAISLLDNTRAIVLYKNVSSTFSRFINIGGGTTITSVSASVSIPSLASPNEISLATITPTRVLVTYTDVNDSIKPKIFGITISGSTITTGTHQTLSTQVSNTPRVIKLSDNKVVVTYNAQFPRFSTVDISSDFSITIGPERTSSLVGPHEVLPLSETQFLLFVTGSTSGVVGIGTVSGNSITFTNITLYIIPSTTKPAIGKFEDNIYIATYDLSNRVYGQAFSIENDAIVAGLVEPITDTSSNVGGEVVQVNDGFAMKAHGESSGINTTLQLLTYLPVIHGLANQNGVGGDNIEIYTI